MTVSTLTNGNRPVVTIKLASTSDELLQCYALRAAVFAVVDRDRDRAAGAISWPPSCSGIRFRDDASPSPCPAPTELPVEVQ